MTVRTGFHPHPCRLPSRERGLRVDSRFCENDRKKRIASVAALPFNDRLCSSFDRLRMSGCEDSGFRGNDKRNGLLRCARNDEGAIQDGVEIEPETCFNSREATVRHSPDGGTTGRDRTKKTSGELGRPG